MQVIIVMEDDHLYGDLCNALCDISSNVIIWDPMEILTDKVVKSILNRNFSYIKGCLKLSLLSGNVIFFTNDTIINDLLVKQLQAAGEDAVVFKYYDSWQPIFQEMFISADCIIQGNIDESLAKLYCSQVCEVDKLNEKCFGLSSSFVKIIQKENFKSFSELKDFTVKNRRNSALLMDWYVRHRGIAAYDFKVDNNLKLKLLMSIFAAVADNGRKNILYVIHADFHEMAENNVGGTQYHLKDLVAGMSALFNVYVLAKDRNGIRFTCYSGKNEQSAVFQVEGDDVGNLNYKRGYSEIYSFCLDLVHVDLVHVHHTMNMTLGIFYEAKKRNIPVIFTVHDYYFLCPLVKRACNLKPSEERCNACLYKNGEIASDINFWHRWWQDNVDVLKDCCRIVAPSNSAKATFSQVFPMCEEKMLVIKHGLHSEKALLKNTYNSNLNVAFIGGLCPEKGSRLIADMIKKGNKDIKWHIFGSIADETLRGLKQSNLIQHGMYQRDDIVGLLAAHKIDLVCILSFLGETYCYTLSEAVLAGIPVMVVDLGAMGERVREMKCGWLLSPHPTVDEALRTLGHIAANRSEYEQVLKNIQEIKFTTVSAMNEQYLDMYREIMRNRKVSLLHREVKVNDFIKFNIRDESKENCRNELHELIALNYKLRRFANSRVGRIAKKINKLRHKIMN